MSKRKTDRKWTRRPKIKVGDRFGRLTVVESAGKDKGTPMWWCVCDCTPDVRIPYPIRDNNLKRENGTQSCGCYQKERAAEAQTTHGQYYEPTHSRWRQMVGRCTNPHDSRYPNYGGRKPTPITVCVRWMDYDNFKADMEADFEMELEIDRTDRRGYWCGKPECPECGPLGRTPQCQWVTGGENRRNKDGVEKFFFRGEWLTAYQIADLTEGRICRSTMAYWLKIKRIDPEVAFGMTPRKWTKQK